MGSDHPVVIFVLGGPGSGKGTQCKKIIDSHPGKFEHLSTGSLLRQAMKDDSAQSKEIQQLMKEGKMVPSKLLVELVKNRIKKQGKGVIYILDGFPRNKENIEAWQEIVGKEFDIKFLLYFRCPEEQLRNRLLSRAKTSGRADDNPETIEKRITTFYSETKPMLEIYEEKKHKVVYVDGTKSIEQVAEQVEKVLKEEKLVE